MMAAIMRSAVAKIARRASLSMEGTRPLHAHRSTDDKPAAEVIGPLVKKIEAAAAKKVLIDRTESLSREIKSQIMSPNLMGVASSCFLAISFVGLFLTGHWVGFRRATEEEYQASSSRKQAPRP